MKSLDQPSAVQWSIMKSLISLKASCCLHSQVCKTHVVIYPRRPVGTSIRTAGCGQICLVERLCSSATGSADIHGDSLKLSCPGLQVLIGFFYSL